MGKVVITGGPGARVEDVFQIFKQCSRETSPVYPVDDSARYVANLGNGNKILPYGDFSRFLDAVTDLQLDFEYPADKFAQEIHSKKDAILLNRSLLDLAAWIHHYNNEFRTDVKLPAKLSSGIERANYILIFMLEIPVGELWPQPSLWFNARNGDGMCYEEVLRATDRLRKTYEGYVASNEFGATIIEIPFLEPKETARRIGTYLEDWLHPF